uniref:Sulfotransferase domain-containing protein n=1 Tax=Strigamia maritima TaxID=126957 RepID=T1JIS9_STRMM
MKKDFSSFLGKNLTEYQVQQVVEHCSFDSMKKNPTTNGTEYLLHFIRKVRH